MARARWWIPRNPKRVARTVRIFPDRAVPDGLAGRFRDLGDRLTGELHSSRPGAPSGDIPEHSRSRGTSPLGWDVVPLMPRLRVALLAAAGALTSVSFCADVGGALPTV